TPAWMAPTAITRRVGGTPLAAAQASVVTALLDARRLDRMALGQEMDPGAGYAPAEYLADVRRAVWSTAAPDANLRGLHRVYLDRLAALVSPPPAGPAAGGGEAGEGPPSPLLAPLNVPRSDLPALARSELTAIRAQARRATASAPEGVQRAHWADVAARVDEILDPAGRGTSASR
ncbi:MAG TPA: zinc-dependent metalloprotease, partial [Longimicrobium sp.]|nr:zinc-dependent metalloprotease [Longimicrobium sp.]